MPEATEATMVIGKLHGRCKGGGPPGPSLGSATDLQRHLDAGKLKDLPGTMISFKTRDNQKPKSLCRNFYMYPSHISHLL